MNKEPRPLPHFVNLKAQWKDMMDRCYDSGHPLYAEHGGRGIKVCDEWHEYRYFEKWANSQNVFHVDFEELN